MRARALAGLLLLLAAGPLHVARADQIPSDDSGDSAETGESGETGETGEDDDDKGCGHGGEGCGHGSKAAFALGMLMAFGLRKRP